MPWVMEGRWKKKYWVGKHCELGLFLSTWEDVYRPKQDEQIRIFVFATKEYKTFNRGLLRNKVVENGVSQKEADETGRAFDEHCKAGADAKAAERAAKAAERTQWLSSQPQLTTAERIKQRAMYWKMGGHKAEHTPTPYETAYLREQESKRCLPPPPLDWDYD